MKAYPRIVGLLLLAVTACSDSDAPRATEPNLTLTPDLELALPSLRQLSIETEDSTSRLVAAAIGSATTEATNRSYVPGDGIHTAGGEFNIPADYRAASRGALITRMDIDVGFIPDAKVAYAQLIGESKGSSYRNHVVLKVRYGNTQVAQNEAVTEESCLCLHLFSPWGQTANVTVPVEGDCGHNAQGTGTHNARLDFLTSSWDLLNLNKDTGSTTGTAFQQDCPPNNNRTGNGGSSGDEDYLICFWEDYYSDGEFVRRKELGCIDLNES